MEDKKELSKIEEVEINEKQNVAKDKQSKKLDKKKFTIFGFTITKLLAYFIIYSIIVLIN